MASNGWWYCRLACYREENNKKHVDCHVSLLTCLQAAPTLWLQRGERDCSNHGSEQQQQRQLIRHFEEQKPTEKEGVPPRVNFLVDHHLTLVGVKSQVAVLFSSCVGSICTRSDFLFFILFFVGSSMH